MHGFGFIAARQMIGRCGLCEEISRAMLESCCVRCRNIHDDEEIVRPPRGTSIDARVSQDAARLGTAGRSTSQPIEVGYLSRRYQANEVLKRS
jgi:hypothetical protein